MKRIITLSIPSGLARASEAYLKSGIDRRSFLNFCAATGFAFTSPSFLTGCLESPSKKPVKTSADTLGPQSASLTVTDQHKFPAEMGRRLAGTTLRIVTEDTLPANAIKKLLVEEFIPVTGIMVEWESHALDRVHAKIVSDTTQKAGFFDVRSSGY